MTFESLWDLVKWARIFFMCLNTAYVFLLYAFYITFLHAMALLCSIFDVFATSWFCNEVIHVHLVSQRRNPVVCRFLSSERCTTGYL